MAFADTLRALRGKESQRAFALRLGVTQPQIHRQETGIGGPTAPVIAGLLRVFPERHAEITAALIESEVEDQDGALDAQAETPEVGGDLLIAS